MGFFDSIYKTFRAIIPSANERALRKLAPMVSAINELEPEMQALSDTELQAKTSEFKQMIDNGAPLDDLLIQAFAVVREAARRRVHRHYDVQLIGGLVLHQGKIAEMKTGEGKTLVATLPAYLNALTGKGVHIVTVNDYLARRDAEWMGRIYNFLGLTTGVIQTTSEQPEHFHAYRCDITYGTNNEFGFDYLRDNMKMDFAEYVQKGHEFAIVDEVDSILIDEARTPLIISGPSEESTDLYVRVDKIIPRLNRDIDYVIDEKSRTASLTESGIGKSEKQLGIENLYDPQNMLHQHHLNQALRAHTLFKRDVDYVIKDGQILIVDEFTGRLMPGRRWSDGLHQAVEAKEGVRIASENQTLATITFQNYFRMYKKLSGMTGTAQTEAAEFAHIYNLDVVSIPTNQQLIRHEHPDVVYKSEREKFAAVVNEIESLNTQGRPVLVGTIAIEKSEKLSRMLHQRKIKHDVLNAKHHEREAEIVAQAGRKGAVTIATNMAGRGTDILLGGNPEFLARQHFRSLELEEDSPEFQEKYSQIHQDYVRKTKAEHDAVVELGGLHILGTERHESRRIDNQLRGRAGRQGDPGSSRFYVSLEDDLMRIFASERMVGIMDRFGMKDGEPIEHNMVTRAIESAQKKVESFHFSARKNILQYDDVMNKQREVIYKQRADVLTKTDYKEMIHDMIEEVLEERLEALIPPKSHPEEWDFESIEKALTNQFGITPPLEHPSASEGGLWMEESFFEYLVEEYKKLYQIKQSDVPPPVGHKFERFILLTRIDINWKDHLLNMDHLKEGIGLRGYGQRDPLTEYKREGYELFQGMISQIKQDSIHDLFFYKPALQPISMEYKKPARIHEGRGQQISSGMDAKGLEESPQAPVKTFKRSTEKVGRNDPCPCGSGKKYKKCCGA